MNQITYRLQREGCFYNNYKNDFFPYLCSKFVRFSGVRSKNINVYLRAENPKKKGWKKVSVTDDEKSPELQAKVSGRFFALGNSQKDILFKRFGGECWIKVVKDPTPPPMQF